MQPTANNSPEDILRILRRGGFQYDAKYEVWTYGNNQVDAKHPLKHLELYAEDQGIQNPGTWASQALVQAVKREQMTAGHIHLSGSMLQAIAADAKALRAEEQPEATPKKEPVELTIQGMTVEEFGRHDTAIEDEARARCREIWTADDTLSQIVKYAQQMHMGDTFPLTILFLAAMQERIVDIDETFYVTVNGCTGAGKSHITSTLRAVLPKGAVLKSGVSDKVISRAGKAYDGRIIVFDDWQPTPTVIEQLKICSERSKEAPLWSTLEPGPGGKLVYAEYTLPERICFIIARVDTAWGSDEEQIRNRVIPVYLDDSPEQWEAKKRMMFRSGVEGYTSAFEESYLYMRKYLWDHLPKRIWVDLEKIEGHVNTRIDEGDRALVHLINLIKCYAVYRQWKGNPDDWQTYTQDGLPKIYAEKDDALPIIEMMNILYKPQNGATEANTGGGRYKMPLAAKRLLDWLLQHYPDEQKTWESERALSREMGGRKGGSKSALRNALYSNTTGENGRGVGALMVVPGLSSEKVQLSRLAVDDEHPRDPQAMNDQYSRVSRTRHEIRWDPQEYKAAQFDGPVFWWVDSPEG